MYLFGAHGPRVFTLLYLFYKITILHVLYVGKMQRFPQMAHLWLLWLPWLHYRGLLDNTGDAGGQAAAMRRILCGPRRSCVGLIIVGGVCERSCIKEIKDITRHSLPHAPESVTLNWWEAQEGLGLQADTISILLAVARLALVLHWNQATLPTLPCLEDPVLGLFYSR